VNIILFDPAEIGKPLPRRDERTLHLLKVLKKKTGDSFDAGILGGMRGSGRIDSIRLDGSVLYSLDLREEAPPRYPVRIAVGFPRPIQIRRILRDLSNMGLAEVDLIGTELGEKSYRNTKMLTDGGAEAALKEGAVQARDTRIPFLSVYNTLEDWLGERPWDRPMDKSTDRTMNRPIEKSTETSTDKFADNFSYTQTNKQTDQKQWSVYSGSVTRRPLLVALDNVRPEGSLALLSALGQSMVLAVGSERGWSDRERDELEGAGFIRLSMGDRALRTETACVTAAALALEKIGVLG